MVARLLLVIVVVLVTLSGCDAGSSDARQISFKNIGPAMVVDVSDDGHWVISTHESRHAILWNLKEKTYRVISAEANIFSAGFRPNSNQYVWQDLKGQVHIADTNGSKIGSFSNFPVYGHALTSKGQYVSVDDEYAIFIDSGKTQKRLKASGGSYQGFGKLLNLSFSPDGSLMVTSGFGSPYDAEWDSIQEQEKDGYKNLVGVVLWDIESMKPLAKLPGNIAKTYATFSPDGRYVVSGSENGVAYVWNAEKYSKMIMLAGLYSGIYIGEGKDLDGLYGVEFSRKAYDKTGLIDAPADFKGEAVLAIKFIDLNNHYLRITTDQHYAILYAIDNPLPLKYLDLGKKPFPATREYARNTAIDSAPAAGILVTGQAYGSGINVYKYDKKTQTLRRIWVAK